MLTKDKVSAANDGTVEIYVCLNRTQRQLKRETPKWSALVKRLSEPERTQETFSAYRKASKAQQGQYKDKGGFVGGCLNNGSRKSGNLLYRSLITLDADSGNMDDVWCNWELEFGNAACLYTTHSHSPESHRFRIVIPLAEELQADECEAVSRYIASVLGIDAFDNTTFEATRLMYWPSVSKDGVFDRACIDGPWLDGKAVLEEKYSDWRDTSQWPVSDQTREIKLREIKKQEDPLEKDNIVGTFCRAYTIHEAIEAFLDDVYEATDKEGRYTYLKGSGYAGLITYDDKFAYSHHGTDPASNGTFNAFDIVRLHKYGELDEGTADKTRKDNYPSFTAMSNFVIKDKKFKKQLASEKLEKAGGDFSGIESEYEGNNTDWKLDLDTDKKGKYLSNYKNIELIMENDPALKGVFGADLFSKRIALAKQPHWRKPDDDYPFLRDDDESELLIYLGKEPWEIQNKNIVETVTKAVCRRNAFHPVQDYLNSLAWDGEKRLERIFVEVYGAEDTEYVRTTTRKMFIAGVQRVMEPGSKMDYVMVFTGIEGAGKSSFLDRMATNMNWFTDACPIKGKESVENIRGKWIVEMGDLASLKYADPSEIKSFISRKNDYYRASYGKNPEDHPRQCIFFGSDNNKNFLKGEGGDRRFWPVPVNKEKITKWWEDFPDSEIDQMWAEAKHYYSKGEKPFLSDELEAVARRLQKEHAEVDPWEDDINDFLDVLLPENWQPLSADDTRNLYDDDILAAKVEGVVKRDRVTTKEIWTLCFKKAWPTDFQNQNRIRKIMNRKEEWEHKAFLKNKKTYKGWVKKV